MLSLTSAYAATTLYEQNGLTLTLGAAAAAAYLRIWDTNFGSGRVDGRTGANTGDAEWAEAYLKPSLAAVYATPKLGRFYGGLSGVATVTVGEGDAGGFTDGGDKDIAEELLYLGWGSGKVLADPDLKSVNFSTMISNFMILDCYFTQA